MASATIDKPARWRGTLGVLASARAWIFLFVLLVVFELWSQIAYGTTFVFSAFNLRSVSVFAVAPVLLGLAVLSVASFAKRRRSLQPIDEFPEPSI